MAVLEIRKTWREEDLWFKCEVKNSPFELPNSYLNIKLVII